jgi:hypothetical protein
MECDVMNTLLLPLCIIVIGSLILQLLPLTIYKWQKNRRYRKQVVATVKQIQVWLDGWYVTAVWTDIVTNRSYTFQSQRIDLNLKQRVGDSVIVNVDPQNPERYRMKL